MDFPGLELGDKLAVNSLELKGMMKHMQISSLSLRLGYMLAVSSLELKSMVKHM